jgi:predicted metal-binding protein
MDKTAYREYLKSPHWQKLKTRKKTSVFYCQACASTTNLHLHHRTYENLGAEAHEDTKVLCSSCHEDLHKKYSEVHGKIVSEKLRIFTKNYMRKGRKKHKAAFLIVWAEKKKRDLIA